MGHRVLVYANIQIYTRLSTSDIDTSAVLSSDILLFHLSIYLFFTYLLVALNTSAKWVNLNLRQEMSVLKQLIAKESNNGLEVEIIWIADI